MLRVGEKIVMKSAPHMNESGFITEILFDPDRDVIEKGSFMVILQNCNHGDENIVVDGDNLVGTGKIVDLKEIDDIIQKADNFTQNTLTYMINHCGATRRVEDERINFVPSLSV